MAETSKTEVLMMKSKMILLVLAFLFVAGWTFSPQIVQAEMEWKIVKDLDLKATPLDIAPSADGQWLFILTPGEILVYSVQEGKVIDQIPVDKDFDRIASSPRANTISLTSSTKKSIRMIGFALIHKIDATGLYFKGPPDAPVTVAVFTDYQWPYCAGLEPILRQLLEKYPKDVKLLMKHFPLPSHTFARKAAIAALAGGKQAKFWEIHDKLFANQKELSDAKVEAIARELGLNLEQFNQDLKDPNLGALVDRDIYNGRQANVQGTPTIFINGKLLNQRNLLGVAIEEELKKKK